MAFRGTVPVTSELVTGAGAAGGADEGRRDQPAAVAERELQREPAQQQVEQSFDREAHSGQDDDPLAAITRHPGVAPMLRDAARRNHDRASHFNVYPTLLAMMGYAPPAAQEGFEPDLFADLSGERGAFLSTYFVRFGREPVWNSIGTSEQLRDGLQQALAEEQRHAGGVGASGSP